MGDDGYSFKKPRTNADVEQVYALMRAVFPGEGVDGILRRLLELYPPMTMDHVY